MKKIEKGQEIIVVTCGNAARRGVKVFNAKIESIGRKYFTISSSEHYVYDVKFDIETLREHSNYSPDYELYLHRSDYDEKKGRPIVIDEINKSFKTMDYCNLKKIQEFIKTLQE